MCNNGYGGDDCSINLSTPPTIVSSSLGSACDSSTKSCNQIILYINGLLISQTITVEYYFSVVI